MAYEFRCIPYAAIRIVEDIGLCDGKNITSYPWLH